LSVLLTKYNSGDKVKNNGVGGACSTCGRKDGCIQVLVGRPEEKRPVENLRLDRRVILKLLFKKCDAEAWIGLIWLRTGTGYGRL
jgi:hypothetical protein